MKMVEVFRCSRWKGLELDDSFDPKKMNRVCRIPVGAEILDEKLGSTAECAVCAKAQQERILMDGQDAQHEKHPLGVTSCVESGTGRFRRIPILFAEFRFVRDSGLSGR